MGTPETAQQPPPSPGKAGKPTTLLDGHEVEWITRELERLLVRESGADGRHHHHRRRRQQRAKVASPARIHEPHPHPHPHAKKGGFLSELLGKHASSICGGDGAGAVASGHRPRGRAGFREVDKV